MATSSPARIAIPCIDKKQRLVCTLHTSRCFLSIFLLLACINNLQSLFTCIQRDERQDLLKNHVAHKATAKLLFISLLLRPIDPYFLLSPTHTLFELTQLQYKKSQT